MKKSTLILLILLPFGCKANKHFNFYKKNTVEYLKLDSKHMNNLMGLIINSPTMNIYGSLNFGWAGAGFEYMINSSQSLKVQYIKRFYGEHKQHIGFMKEYSPTASSSLTMGLKITI